MSLMFVTPTELSYNLNNKAMIEKLDAGFIYCIICSIIFIGLGIYAVITTKKKEEVINAWLCILVGFTPGAALIITLALFGLFMWLLMQPATLISKIKGLK